MDDKPQTDSDEPTNDHTDGPSKPEREGKAIRAIDGDDEEHKDELRDMRFSVNRLHDERRTELIPEFWPSNMTPAQSRLWAAMEEFTTFRDGALVIGDRKASFLDLPFGTIHEPTEEITGLELHEALRAGFEKAVRLAKEYREAMTPLFDLAAELADETLQTLGDLLRDIDAVSPPDEDETPHAASEGPSRDEDAEDADPGPFDVSTDPRDAPLSIAGEEIPTERLTLEVESNLGEPLRTGLVTTAEARELFTRGVMGEVSRDDELDALRYSHATRKGRKPGGVESLDDLRERLGRDHE